MRAYSYGDYLDSFAESDDVWPEGPADPPHSFDWLVAEGPTAEVWYKVRLRADRRRTQLFSIRFSSMERAEKFRDRLLELELQRNARYYCGAVCGLHWTASSFSNRRPDGGLR